MNHTIPSRTTVLPRTSYFQPLFLQNLIACSGVSKVIFMFDIGSAVLVHPISGFDQRSCERRHDTRQDAQNNNQNITASTPTDTQITNTDHDTRHAPTGSTRLPVKDEAQENNTRNTTASTPIDTMVTITDQDTFQRVRRPDLLKKRRDAQPTAKKIRRADRAVLTL